MCPNQIPGAVDGPLPAGTVRLPNHHERFHSMRRTNRTLAAAAAVSAGLLLGGPSVAQDAEIKVGPGLTISSPDGSKSVSLTGRLHWDLGLYSDAPDEYNGTLKKTAGDKPISNAEDIGLGTGVNLRRGLLGVKGRNGNMSFNLTIDVGGSADDNNEAKINEAAIYYSPSRNLKLGFGKMKIPVTFEESISSNDINFIERSLPVDMFTDKTLGPKAVNGQVWYYGSQFLVEAAYHFMSDTETKGEKTDEDTGITLRLVGAPVMRDNLVVHVGGWYDRSDGPASENGARWGYRPELNVADAKLLYGSSVGEVDSMTHYGLELAALYNSFWFQGEWISGEMDPVAAGARTAEADGWYLQAGYVFRGAKRYDMKKGAWKAPKVGGAGVMEAAIRYSVMDMGDPTSTGTHGGKQTNLTLGLNWYLNGNSRIMFNAIQVDLDEALGAYRECGLAPALNHCDSPAPKFSAEPVSAKFWIYGIRYQYKF